MLGKILEDPTVTGLKAEFTDLGSVVSGLLNIVFLLAGFLAFFWLVWGGFQYIFAGGDKEALAKARSRIIWAIVGLILVALAFLVAQWTGQILQPKGGTPITLFIEPVHAVVDIGEKFPLATEKTKSLGEAVGLLVKPAFSLATLAVVIYFIMGAFKYLSSGGDKEAVASAQGTITHAIVGFVILMFAFLIFQFVMFNLFGIKGFALIGGPGP